MVKCSFKRKALGMFFLHLFLGFGIAAQSRSEEPAQLFRFKYVEGGQYRINSFVRESVFVNSEFSHQADIINRIIFTTSGVKIDEKAGTTSAVCKGTFMTSEKTNRHTYPWTKEYTSNFIRDERGLYQIDTSYFMPTVRNVPVFPETAVSVGDSWEHEGHEAHDLTNLGLEMPFVVPFVAHYTYKGTTKKDGVLLHIIAVEYVVSYDVPQKELAKNRARLPELYPIGMQGMSKQRLLWNNELGFLPEYFEDFLIALKLNTGEIVHFKGSALAKVVEIPHFDEERVKTDLNKAIKKEKLADVSVDVREEGVTLSLERIRFLADSAVLLDSEKVKLKKIAEILKKFPDNNLLISGHTALAGTPSSRQMLSEKRAEAVAQFLIQQGVRQAEEIFTRGFGADRPIAPNTDEKNKSRNRRVEITILNK